MTNNAIADQITKAELKYRKQFCEYVRTVAPLLEQANSEYSNQGDFSE